MRELGGKRKAEGLLQGIQPMEEDDAIIPKVKVMKLELINDKTIGKLEANPRMSPKCK